jgi:putative transcriptional regulator
VTTITHHLDEATILAFAAGTLPEALGFAAATHAAYCKQCRDAVRAAEVLGGGLLMQESSTVVTDDCRAATLAKLDAVVPSMKEAVSNSATANSAAEVPAVLCNLLDNTKLADLRWKTKAPGVAMYEIPLSRGGKTRLQLLRIGPGRSLPEHGHGGEELTVVLRGSYKDHTGRYLAGDVADLDEETEHQPTVDSDEDCICLVAIEAPTKFKGLLARLAQPFVGI